jgi:hypothetical protein
LLAWACANKPSAKAFDARNVVALPVDSVMNDPDCDPSGEPLPVGEPLLDKLRDDTLVKLTSSRLVARSHSNQVL